MPAMTHPRTVSYPAAPAPRRRGRPGWQIAVLAGVAVLVVAAAATVVVLLVASRGPGTFTVTGSVELKTGQFEVHDGNPATCNGIDVYQDLRGGADASIADAKGKFVAIGRFAAGSPRTGWCSLWFTIANVPRGAGPYGLWVTHRGPKPYTEAQLAGRLTLGFD